MPAYCTAAELKTYIDTALTDDDSLLSDFIDRAQDYIDRYCDRTFTPDSDTTRYFHVHKHVQDRDLYLDRDLCQLTSITNGDGNAVASTEYVLYPRNWQTDGVPVQFVRLKGKSSVYWTYGDDPDEDQVAIVGRWAYSLAAPKPIKQACLRLSAYYYKQRDAGTFDVIAVPEAGIITVPQGFPRDVEVLLRPYRKVRIAGRL